MVKSIQRKVYIESIKGFIGKDIIKIITGIRRCGKSEILKLIYQELIKTIAKDHIIFINFENLNYDFISNYHDLYEYVMKQMVDDEKYYLLFDEIQNVHQWEKAVNSFRLNNTEIYITGSNSNLLSKEFATLLSGRYVQFVIRPLSFIEFIDFRKENDFKNYTDEYLVNNDFVQSLKDYIIFGGFPFLSVQEFTIPQSRQILKDIHSSIVLNDVVSRNNIKNVSLLEKIISYFYNNIGNITSLRNISNYISGGDKEKGASNLVTISNYISYLESAYIIQKVSRYDIKGKRIFEFNDKYYLTDHSLAFVLKDYEKIDKGGLLENIVYNELVNRQYNVYVGKLETKEIDFIAEKNGSRIYLQVCLEFTTEDTYNREISPLKMIKDNNPKYIITLDNYTSINDEGIISISLKDFLLKKHID